MRRRFAVAVAVAGLAAAVLTACSSGGAATTEVSTAQGDELVALAQQEGQVVWYAGSLQPAIESVQRAFQEAYGIAVVVPERLSSAQLAQRIDADVRSTGALGADVIQTADPALSAYLRAEGYSAELTADQFPGVGPEFLQGDGAVACAVVVPVVGYNTAGLTDLAIDSWDDLLDPRLAGRLMLVDPRGSGAWAQMYATLLEDPDRGEAYLQRLGAQDNQPVPNSIVGSEQLVAGQGDVFVAGTPSILQAAADAGQPVAYWSPTDPSPVSFTNCLVSASAQHPNAARLFLEWLMSEEGQAALNIPDYTASPLGDIPGAPVPLPAEISRPEQPEQVQQEQLPRILELLRFS
jgi:iron(III) transport system substrate-binding protein